MPTEIIQTSFTTGEVSPRLHGRTDVQKYFNGCRTLENFMIFPHGGITRRPGTEYLAECIDSSEKSRLIPFQFNVEQVYVVEISNGVVRFFKDGGIIWSPATTCVATSSTIEILGTTYVSSMHVTHTSGGVLQVLRFQIPTDTWWTIKVGTTAGGSDILSETDGLYTGWHTQEFTPPSGNTSFYITFTDYSEQTGDQITDIEFLNNEAVSLTVPYATDDIFDIDYCQSADILFLSHRGYSPGKLTRRGHQSWDFLYATFGPSVFAPTNLTATKVGTGEASKSWYYAVTTVTDGIESEVSNTASVYGTSTLSNSDYINLTWDAVAGAERYNVYRAQNGVWYYIGEAYALTSPTLADNGVTPDTSTTPPTRYNYFDSAGNYPGNVTFFEQRLVFGGTDNKPQTIYMSKTADFYNFDRSIPIKDDDRCVFTIDSDEVNDIRWVCPGQHLYIGTSSAEYYMSSTDGASAITPSNVMCRRTTSYGSARIKPVMIGEETIFVCRGAHKIRSMSYKYTTDNYTISMVAPDLTLFSEHLFRDSTVSSMALAQNPDPYVYVVRSDGVICVLAYMKEQQVAGWSRVVTDGEFESVAVIHGDESDEVYATVKRSINGANKRYVERFYVQHDYDNTTDGCFMDCSQSLTSSTAVTTVSGLDYLEGKTVQIVADGKVQPEQIVSGGSVTLEESAYTVKVGLPYTSTLVPIQPDINTQQEGSAQGRTWRFSRVTARIHNTLGLKVGPDEDSLIETVLRDSSWDLGTAPELYTGDVAINFPGAYERGMSMVFKVTDPLPCTILALYYEVSVYGR